jgi:hypothetical protein
VPKIATHNELPDQGSVDREFDNVFRKCAEVYLTTAAPSFTPLKAGDICIDQINSKVYISKDKTASTDWLILN